MVCNESVIFGAGLGILAMGFALLAWWVSGSGPIGTLASAWFVWCALVSGFVATGYLRNDAHVFGKLHDGRRMPWASVWLLPYFGGVAIARWLQRTVTGEDAYNLVAPGLYVGRLVGTSELPDDVTFVADLTAELTEPLETRRKFGYACLPTLDGTAPEVESLRSFADELDAHNGVLYVHCAAGHGRAAMMAAVVLMRRGLAKDVYAAQKMMRAKRPKVRMTRVQREAATSAARSK